MNTQEKEDLIQALYDIGGCEAEDEWARGYDDGVNAAIDVIKEVKVQEKVVLPKTADDFIKEGEGIGSDKVDIIDSAISFARAMPTAEFSKWFKTNGDLLIDALANGYEVEKEQLYYVKLPGIGYLNNSDGGIKHTEKEIKAIDKRYWPFAVKVDGE
ncbi:RNA-binding protein [Enterococcus faecalis]|uniref:DUF1642 domain-containing protein n=1 Tax=Enterococcus faecalis TaxID=1351 RepID=UPI00100EF450|nr:DUF1642 domain-containing protein [Enterococcus faecalis]RXU81028.1 RNA-binding protein [Enterococcus faecalis]